MLWLVGGPAPATAATFSLDDGSDAVDAAPGDGLCASAAGRCTLRAAIQEANALAGPDRIVFLQLGGPEVTLSIPGTGEDAAATGDLDVTEDLEIDGDRSSEPSTWFTAVTGGGLDRILHVHAGAALHLNALELRGGTAAPGESGGAISNEGTLVIDSAAFEDNAAPGGDGGALFNGGTATVHGQFDRNQAPAGRGGAIANLGTLTLDTGAIRAGTAASGGAVFNAGTASFSGTPLVTSTATGGVGGGLENAPGAVAHLSNLTVGGNAASTGAGGIDNAGTVDLHNVTVTENGIGLRTAAGATTTAENSVLADQCSGAVTSGGYNVSATCTLAGPGPGDRVADPDLEPLGCPSYREYFTAVTCSVARLRATSPAINAGNPTGCRDHLGQTILSDQRGARRSGSPGCDVGAAEWVLPCERGYSTRTARLLVKGIGDPPGKQTIRFVGSFDWPVNPFFLRPPGYGAQIAIEDVNAGTPLIDRSHVLGPPILPDLLAGYSSCHRWRFPQPDGRYIYKESGSRSCGTPAGTRIVKFKTVDARTTTGTIDVDLRTTATVPAGPSGPIRVSVTFGYSVLHAANGACGTHEFSTGDCVRMGSTLDCR